MRLMSPILLALPLLTLGCKSKTEIIPLGPPGESFEPVPPESVFVFQSEDRIRIKYRPLAHISLGYNYSGGPDEDSREMEEALRKRAARRGAHGIILGTRGEVADDVQWGHMPAGAATAIRFLDPDGLGEESAVRSPAGLKTIAIAPLAVPEDLAVPDSIVAGFHQDIHDQLLAGGFKTVPVEAWDAAWESIDPGAPTDSSFIQAIKGQDPAGRAEQRILQRLEEEYGADGFLFPDMIGVEAWFDGDEARWDGIRQKVGETRSTGAKIVSGLINLFTRGEGNMDDPDPEGSVTALSLQIRIENAIGAHLYTGRGGIELIEGADFEGGIYFGDPGPEDYEVIEVPDEALFQKQSRLERAVRIALEPLVAAKRASRSKSRLPSTPPEPS